MPCFPVNLLFGPLGGRLELAATSWCYQLGVHSFSQLPRTACASHLCMAGRCAICSQTAEGAKSQDR